MPLIVIYCIGLFGPRASVNVQYHARDQVVAQSVRIPKRKHGKKSRHSTTEQPLAYKMTFSFLFKAYRTQCHTTQNTHPTSADYGQHITNDRAKLNKCLKTVDAAKSGRGLDSVTVQRDRPSELPTSCAQKPFPSPMRLPGHEAIRD